MTEHDYASPKPTDGYRARDLVGIPGLLSLSRAPLAMAFPLLYRSALHAVVLLVVAALTDVLDGWYARRHNLRSITGEVLDGVMDKLFGLSVLGTLLAHHALSIVEALMLSTREVGEALLLTVAIITRPRATAAPRPAHAFGKLATTLQFATVVVVLTGVGPRAWCVYGTGLCGGLAAAAYWRREFVRD